MRVVERGVGSGRSLFIALAVAVVLVGSAERVSSGSEPPTPEIDESQRSWTVEGVFDAPETDGMVWPVAEATLELTRVGDTDEFTLSVVANITSEQTNTDSRCVYDTTRTFTGTGSFWFDGLQFEGEELYGIESPNCPGSNRPLSDPSPNSGGAASRSLDFRDDAMVLIFHQFEFTVTPVAQEIDTLTQGDPEAEWGVIVLDDGSIDLVPPPDGVLSISRSDLPEWAADQIATVGAPIAVVGPPDVVLEGDNRVLIDGAPAARLGDPTGQGGQIVDGSDRILVNGTPAAVVGSNTVNPMVTGGVPHVGGPIAAAGTYDAYRLLTDPVYREEVLAIAEAEYFIWEVETLDKFGYAYGMSLYDVLRTERAITEQRVEIAIGRALAELQRAGVDVVWGDFDGVEIGDGIVIGGNPTDVGIVVDKGSLVLDRPLQHDHPAGTPLLVVPADLIEEARAQMTDADGDGSSGLLLVVGAAGVVALIVVAFTVRSRRRGASPSPP